MTEITNLHNIKVVPTKCLLPNVLFLDFLKGIYAYYYMRMKYFF
jgi:hypothetical protein